MPRPAPTDFLVERIDALLPQTQCTRCGFPTCRAYAEAIADDRAGINQCPPGGAEGVAALAQLLDRESTALNPTNGREEAPTVAFIDEDVCIGCTKCIQACPVDAIVGAAKRMHTIIAAECTGCGLCLPPCPVDCIALLPIAPLPLARAQVLARAAQARARFDARNARRLSSCERRRPRCWRRNTPRASRLPPLPQTLPCRAPRPSTRSAVLEAIARGKARRAIELKEPSSR